MPEPSARNAPSVSVVLAVMAAAGGVIYVNGRHFHHGSVLRSTVAAGVTVAGGLIAYVCTRLGYIPPNTAGLNRVVSAAASLGLPLVCFLVGWGIVHNWF